MNILFLSLYIQTDSKCCLLYLESLSGPRLLPLLSTPTTLVQATSSLVWATTEATGDFASCRPLPFLPLSILYTLVRVIFLKYKSNRVTFLLHEIPLGACISFRIES